MPAPPPVGRVSRPRGKEHRVRRIVEEEGGPDSVVSWQAVDEQGPG